MHAAGRYHRDRDTDRQRRQRLRRVRPVDRDLEERGRRCRGLARPRQRGAAYVFTSYGQGFSQSAELTPPSTDSGDQLGTSVAISGDGKIVVAGAGLANNDTVADNGSAIISGARGRNGQTGAAIVFPVS